MARKSSITTDIARNFIEVESNSGCILVSEKCENSRVKIQIKCNCGNVYETRFSDFKNSNQRQCKSCGLKNRSKQAMLNYDEVKHYIEVESNSGCKLISKSFEGVKINLKIMCRCGTEFEKDYGSFKYSKLQQCNTCAKEKQLSKMRTSYDEVKHFVEIESNSGCKLISDTYINNKTKIKIECCCGNHYEAIYKDFKIGKQRQCPDCGKVNSGLKRRNQIEYNCDYCGNLCSTRASSYENKERHFCDAKCYGKWYGENLVGENSYTWNPNLTQEEREAGRDYNEYYNFTKEVYERDYYTCQCCGVKGGNINAHHIYSYNKYKTVRTDISNGITFCTTCHKEFHKKHGNGNNDWYQLREFIYDKWVDSNDLNLVALLEEIDLRMNNIKELVESA